MTSAASQSSVRFYLFAAIAAIAAGLVIAGLLWWTSGRGGGVPSGPFSLGLVEGLQENVEEEGPVYIADPTGGEGLWLDLDGTELVALVAVPPENPRDCPVRWRDTIGSYTDCADVRYDAEDLDRYLVVRREGLLIVDTGRTIPREVGEG